jgi:hypothetical protein
LDSAAVAFTASGQSNMGDEEMPDSAATVPFAGAMTVAGFVVFSDVANLGAGFEADFALRLAQQS